MRRILAFASLLLAATPVLAQQGNQGVPVPGNPASPLFNVASYGALCDGVTNFTSQIQAAASAVPSSGGVLYFPRSAGACIVSSSITIANPTAVVADSATATGVKLANGSNAHVFTVTSSNVGFYK